MQVRYLGEFHSSGLPEAHNLNRWGNTYTERGTLVKSIVDRNESERSLRRRCPTREVLGNQCRYFTAEVLICACSSPWVSAKEQERAIWELCQMWRNGMSDLSRNAMSYYRSADILSHDKAHLHRCSCLLTFCWCSYIEQKILSRYSHPLAGECEIARSPKAVLLRQHQSALHELRLRYADVPWHVAQQEQRDQRG